MHILHGYEDKLTASETNENILELALLLATKVADYDQRILVQRFIAGRDYLGLCSYNVPYSTVSVHDAILLRQICSLFSKRADLDIGVDRKTVAIGTFVDTEHRCRQSNEVFRAWEHGRFQFRPCVEGVLHAAQRKVSRALGQLPDIGSLDLRFGPGATTNTIKRNASPRYKLGAALSCSGDLQPIVSELLAEMPHLVDFGDSEVKTVPVEVHAGRVVFVRKNAKTDRSITTVPMLNSLIQLGIGDFIAGRLKRFGVDITDQTRNQRMARVGSIDGTLATCDLSSASDMVSIGVVRHLLPWDWFDFLSKCRTSTVLLENEPITLQKFSTMGEGFTFALETLIFWSLASSCVEHADQESVSVYGDDIIVPTYAIPLLYEVLNAVGFQVNKTKSYASGPFRESCGADYLSGINIRPVYLKDSLDLPAIMVLYNYFHDTYQEDEAALILSWIHEDIRLFGPQGYGDGHLHRRGFEPCPHNRKKGWGGWTFETLTTKKRRSYKPSPGDYVYPLYCIYRQETADKNFDTPFKKLHLRKHADEARRAFGRLLATVESESFDEKDFVYITETAFYDRHGRLGCTVPGSKGLKRIKIYTLSPSSLS